MSGLVALELFFQGKAFFKFKCGSSGQVSHYRHEKAYNTEAQAKAAVCCNRQISGLAAHQSQ